MKDLTIKFPDGITGAELLHYMGAGDPYTLIQRPIIAQHLAEMCKPGKEISLTRDQLEQLIKEVENMLSIKEDHLGHGWNNLQHHNLKKYLELLKSMRG